MNYGTMEVVINCCYGGFSLSDKAEILYRVDNETSRDHPKLIQCVREMGEESFGPFAKLKIVTAIVNPEFDWVIEEHDGFEHIAYQPKGEN